MIDRFIKIQSLIKSIPHAASTCIKVFKTKKHVPFPVITNGLDTCVYSVNLNLRSFLRYLFLFHSFGGGTRI